MAIGMRRRLGLGARTDAAELLESGRLSRSEVEANLADLARLNRLPGGTDASIRAIERLMGTGNGARILDVGTGAGDMPIAFSRRGWRTVAADVNPEVLAVARARLARVASVEVIEADVLALPLDDGAVDVAHCSLLIHHLAPDEAVVALREMRRVARRGVVVNDLRRGPFPVAVTWVMVMALGRSRVTHIDGMASAWRSYTVPELDGLLAAAGLTRLWRSPSWLPRVVTAASA
jgi:ubiquinone/menaquinone biosynthesis C-methylase UbiE